jgi:hypothetical protein
MSAMFQQVVDRSLGSMGNRVLCDTRLIRLGRRIGVLSPRFAA